MLIKMTHRAIADEEDGMFIVNHLNNKLKRTILTIFFFCFFPFVCVFFSFFSFSSFFVGLQKFVNCVVAGLAGTTPVMSGSISALTTLVVEFKGFYLFIFKCLEFNLIITMWFMIYF